MPPTLSWWHTAQPLAIIRMEIGNVGELHNLEDEPWPTSKATALALMN